MKVRRFAAGNKTLIVPEFTEIDAKMSDLPQIHHQSCHIRQIENQVHVECRSLQSPRTCPWETATDCSCLRSWSCLARQSRPTTPNVGSCGDGELGRHRALGLSLLSFFLQRRRMQAFAQKKGSCVLAFYHNPRSRLVEMGICHVPYFWHKRRTSCSR